MEVGILKFLGLFVLALGVTAAPASASLLTFSITDLVNQEVDQADAHREQSWDFTGQAGWSQYLTIDSVTVEESFTLILPGGTPATPNFQSTIITDLNPLASQSKIFTIFPAENLTSGTESTTLTPGVGGFTAADITTGGELGEFATRVARNGGGFFLESVTITIDASTPEPAGFALMGLGLIGLAAGARRLRQRPVTSRITRK